MSVSDRDISGLNDQVTCSQIETMYTLVRKIGLLATLEKAQTKCGRSPQAEDLSLQKGSAVLVRGGLVEWVGPERKVLGVLKSRGVKGLKEIDAEGATVIPGLIDCHTHLIYSGDRSDEFERRLQGESYTEIARGGGGILKTVAATRRSSLEELIEIGERRAARLLRQGVTTIEAKTGYGLSIASELKLLKAYSELRRRLRQKLVITLLAAHAVPQEMSDEDEWLTEVEKKVFPKARGLADRVDIYIEKDFFTPERGRFHLERARQLGFATTVHADQLTPSGGTQVAIEMASHSADHVIQISDWTLRALARSNTAAVLLPASDLYMRCAYPRARALLDAGAVVALASDVNPGTCPSQDLALTGLLARLEMKMSLPEVLVGFTVSAAHALGLSGQVGVIQPRARADLAFLGGEISDLFYHAGHMPVAKVMCAGRLVEVGEKGVAF
jgi:imidazolonepropionase